MAYSYTIGIDVEGTSGVNAAASAVEVLDDGLGGVQLTADDFNKSFKKIQDEAKNLAKATGNVAKEAEKAKINFGELEGAFGKLGGPIGRIGQLGAGLGDTFQKLRNTFSLSTVVAIGFAAAAAAVAVAVVAAAVAVAALGAAMVGAAIKASDSANNLNILREGLTGSAAAAGELTSTIKSVASSVPISTAEVGKLAEGLYKAGKRGAELEEALLAASYEAAGLGKNPGPELIAKKMATLGAIGTKLKDNIAEIFAGASTVDATSKFTRALGGITELFGQNTSEGRALQKLLSVIVDPIIDSLTEAMPLGKAFFQGLIIGALDIAIMAAKAAKALGLIPPEDAKENVDALTVALEAGKIAMYAILAVVAILAVIFVIVAAAFLLVAVSTLAALAAIAALAVAVVAVVAAVVMVGKKVFDDLSKWGSWGLNAAKNLINGLVSGIKSGVGPVVDAVKAMASSAVNAIKSALKIASPSKIFEDLGGYTGEGFAVGIEGETAMVQSSLETMVAPPKTEVPSLQAPSGGGMSGSGGGGGVDLSGATFVFHGVKDAEHGASLFEEALTRIFEGDALAVGAT